MKQTRARRPQPAIREQRANTQDKASLSPRGGAKVRGTGAAPEGSAPRGRKPQGEAAKPASMRTGDLRRARQAARTPKDGDEWHSRPEVPRAKPAQARSETPRTAPAADGDTVAKPVAARRKPAAPVVKAKRLRQRADSQKVVAIQKQLRAKRLTSDQVGDERLQKALAFSGIGSRREMEEWIAAGRVSINGKVAELGAKVSHGDEVRVDGKRIPLKWQDRLPRVLIYHKEEGELVTRDDPEGRTTVFDRLPRMASSKWVAIGRLDFNTSGLLIFTTSGDLANRMTHPSFEVEREYAVRVHGELTPDQMLELKKGITLDDGPAKFQSIVAAGGEGQNHWYHVVLKEGRNREVRRMFEHYELVVSRLMRVRFGMLNLPSRLKRGQYYELSETEVLGVMKWAGLRLNGQAKTER
ncbi:23S rRNA pseudouridine2605 synthase [Andreprevotia lacus DSM 23236]|jgi:23S rRNA pseudouridine2605 synthase|uniref:Pseudouridine synthase n=1 Tax=Andreprevotia lacus DSM 23236 TaxID=1121001 RepID=A0A1W1XE97_9NEIS|nr:pseudouridine synthase [Andreprevotia lacus]SMC22256.1 23S rRNA pseudouridine2605 synthase [Andreprevotia lacus DSM 23236]